MIVIFFSKFLFLLGRVAANMFLSVLSVRFIPFEQCVLLFLRYEKHLAAHSNSELDSCFLTKVGETFKTHSSMLLSSLLDVKEQALNISLPTFILRLVEITLLMSSKCSFHEVPLFIDMRRGLNLIQKKYFNRTDVSCNEANNHRTDNVLRDCV